MLQSRNQDQKNPKTPRSCCKCTDPASFCRWMLKPNWDQFYFHVSTCHIEFKHRIPRVVMTSVMSICLAVAIPVKVYGSVTQSNISARYIKVHWQNWIQNSYTKVAVAMTKSFCRSRLCWRQRLEMLPPQDQVKLCQALFNTSNIEPVLNQSNEFNDLSCESRPIRHIIYSKVFYENEGEFHD